MSGQFSTGRIPRRPRDALFMHPHRRRHNLANAWLQRGGVTLPAHYGDTQQEALAARVSAILADISALERLLRFHGAGAAALLSSACACDAGAIAVGHSLKVHWCTDGGGVRGVGDIARFGETNFVLRSANADFGWFAAAAKRFNATVRDASGRTRYAADRWAFRRRPAGARRD